jgi:hypothetical protein
VTLAKNKPSVRQSFDFRGKIVQCALEICAAALICVYLHWIAGHGVSGSVTFAVESSHGAETARPDGSNEPGGFSLGRVTESNGTASVEFDFKSAAKTGLSSGQTSTQSYTVSIADSQNPAVAMNQTLSFSAGGPGNDNFVVEPGIGADAIVKFDARHDTVELDNFTGAQAVQQLHCLIPHLIDQNS